MGCLPTRVLREVDGHEKANQSRLFPDELLLKIFSHLGQRDLLLGAALVCKDWARVAMDPLLWTEVELVRSRRLSMERAKELIRHMTWLRKVRLVHWEPPRVNWYDWKSPTVYVDLDDWKNLAQYADELLQVIVETHPKLEVLELAHCNFIYMDCLEQVASNCTDIKELAVNCSSVWHPNYPHIFDVFGNSSNLEKITLRSNEFLSYCHLDTSTRRNWPKLREVDLSRFFGTADRELEVVCRSAAGSLRKLSIFSAVGHQALLNLSQCTLLEDLSALVFKTDHLNQPIRNLRNLRRLNLVPGVHEVWDSFFSMQGVFQKLERIDLSQSLQLSDTILSEIATHCPELTSIYVSSRGITKDGLEDLLTRSHKLKSLEVLLIGNTEETEHCLRDLKELRTFFPDIDVVARNF